MEQQDTGWVVNWIWETGRSLPSARWTPVTTVASQAEATHEPPCSTCPSHAHARARCHRHGQTLRKLRRNLMWSMHISNITICLCFYTLCSINLCGKFEDSRGLHCFSFLPCNKGSLLTLSWQYVSFNILRDIMLQVYFIQTTLWIIALGNTLSLSTTFWFWEILEGNVWWKPKTKTPT